VPGVGPVLLAATAMPRRIRLRRGAVLRWVRGWYVEHDLDRPPRIVLGPAISPYE